MTCCRDSSHPNWAHCAVHSLFGVCSFPLSIPVGYGGVTPKVVTPVGGGGSGNPHADEIPEMLAEALEQFWGDPNPASFAEIITVLGNEGWYDYALGAAEYAKKHSQTPSEYADAVRLETNLLRQVADAYESGIRDIVGTLNILHSAYASEVWKRLQASVQGGTVVDPIEIENVLIEMPGNVNISGLVVEIAEKWNSQIALGRLLAAP